jgi:hypothetical protein
MTLHQAATWAVIVYAIMPFLSGWRLARAVAWLGLWQALTPVRPSYIDIPLLLLCWGGAEIAFHYLRGFLFGRTRSV